MTAVYDKEKFREGIYKKQKRQDWDHKASSHIIMHQVLYYIVQLPKEEGDVHYIALGALCDPNLVCCAFYTITIYIL